jgi:ribonuclease E
MAGLIVIDFIDMEQNSHVRKVEKAMKEALRTDRARIQVGRISSFGLMEMSRQRLRTGVLEASTKPCPHCEGTGLMRTAASAGLSALRIIEDEATRGRGERILLRAGKEAAVYVLNKKRAELADIEQRYGVSIEIVIDESFEGARMTVESSGPRPTAVPRPEPVAVEEPEDEEPVAEADEEDEADEQAEETVEISLEGDQEERGEERHGRRRRRRRRGGRGRGRREGAEGEATLVAEEGEAPAEEQPAEEAEAVPAEAEGGKRRRRRRARKDAETSAEPVVEPESSPMVERPIDEELPIAETQAAEEAKPKRRRSRKAAAESEPAPAEAPPAETADEAAPAAKPARKRKTKAKAEPEEAEPAAEEPVGVPTANNDTAEDSGEPRRGWWQRTFG